MMQFSLNVPNDIVERARGTVIFHVIQFLVPNNLCGFPCRDSWKISFIVLIKDSYVFICFFSLQNYIKMMSLTFKGLTPHSRVS